MRSYRPLPFAIALLVPGLAGLVAASCAGSPEPVEREPVALTAGTPVAGMAEGPLDLPMGAPLGGYTGRCNCFGNEGEVDDRKSAYINNFNPSAGMQVRPRGTALWLENGDQQFIWLKVGSIYVYEGVVEALEARLSEATGVDMDGKVLMSSGHSHASPANFDAGMTWFLGGDRYNHEVFERYVGSLEDIALEAYGNRQDAAIGIGMARDWDPDDQVYSDRRGENDSTQFFDDIEAGSYKDPNLTLLRIDTAEGEPMGFYVAFGMHGTALGGDNQMWSSDAPGHIELMVRERFDEPLVIAHLQHGGGDASPRGGDSGFANLESVGERAADAIVELWEQTPTSTEAFSLEVVGQYISTSRDDIAVTRNGEVDWYYAPYDDSEDFAPDEEIYDDNGEIISPIDEFNTQYGGAFCGADTPLIPGISIGSTTPPYQSCVDVETIGWIIAGFFDLDPETDLVLPLEEWEKVGVAAARMGPVAIRTPEGTEVSDDALFAFFPGEPVAVFTEQFRRRAADEVGFDYAFPIGYSQDHYGYLLTPEDWLLGGYEIDITVWGPLVGEHVMEGVLDIAAGWLTSDTVREPMDPLDEYQPIDYWDEEMPTAEPDSTASAGTMVSVAPEYLYVPLEGLELELAPPTEDVPRAQGMVQMVWSGGDPGVDLPTVYLERYDDDSGDWVEVTTRSGRAVTDELPDILLAHTPDPLYPYQDPQEHTWWAAWQAVGSVNDRLGLAEGTYRLHVYGHSYDGGSTTWPWAASEYEVVSDGFEVVPAAVTVSLDADDSGDTGSEETWGTLSATIYGHGQGYRLLDLDGSSQGANPVRDATVVWTLSDGSTLSADEAGAEEATISGGTTSWQVLVPTEATSVTVTDAYGNTGSASL